MREVENHHMHCAAARGTAKDHPAVEIAFQQVCASSISLSVSACFLSMTIQSLYVREDLTPKIRVRAVRKESKK